MARQIRRHSPAHSKKPKNPWPALLAVGFIAIALVLLIIAFATGNKKKEYQPPVLHSEETKAGGESPGPEGTSMPPETPSKPKVSAPAKAASFFFDALRTKDLRNLKRHFDYPIYRKTLREADGIEDDWRKLTLFEQEREKDKFFLPLVQKAKIQPFQEGTLTLVKENTETDTSVLTYRLRNEETGAEWEHLLRLARTGPRWIILFWNERVVSRGEDKGAGIVRLGSLNPDPKEKNEEKEFLSIASGEEDGKPANPLQYLEGVVAKVQPYPETTAQMKKEIRVLIQKVVDPSLTSEAYKARDGLKELGKHAVPYLLNELVDRDYTDEKAVFKAHLLIQVLRAITGQSFGFSPQMGTGRSMLSGSIVDRERAIRHWFGWWQANKDFFTADLRGLGEETGNEKGRKRKK